MLRQGQAHENGASLPIVSAARSLEALLAGTSSALLVNNAASPAKRSDGRDPDSPSGEHYFTPSHTRPPSGRRIARNTPGGQGGVVDGAGGGGTGRGAGADADSGAEQPFSPYGSDAPTPPMPKMEGVGPWTPKRGGSRDRYCLSARCVTDILLC